MYRDDIRATVALSLFAIILLVGPTLYAQAGVAAGVPVPEPNGANEWGGALVWAFFSSSALEWLKRKAWFSPLSERTAWGVQRVIGVILATAAAMGVHWAFDPAAGRLVIDGLIPASMWTIGTESVRQWTLQELAYRTAVKTYRPDNA